MYTHKRKNNFKILLVMLFASIIFFGKAVDFYGTAFSFQPNFEFEQTLQTEEELLNQQSNLAEGINLSENVISYASSFEETVTIYNFVIAIKFSGESTRMDDVWGYGKTYYEAFDQMYNTGIYSVNEFYKNVTNGQVNLVSVIINDRFPVTSNYARLRYLEKTVSNPSGYNPAEKQLIRSELLSLGFNNLLSFIDDDQYRDMADFDGDGNIDSVSMIILPPSSAGVPNPGWSDVLWPHQGAFYPLLGGISFQDSQGKTISSDKYMLDYMEYTQIVDPVMQAPSATIAIHELGHLVFNLPDLYAYEKADLDYPDPVHWWDVMVGALPRAQYMTTYLREKARWGSYQGFVKPNQIKEIETNGDYILQPVNYEEVNSLPFSSERVIAYKLVNPNKPTQAIYMEYRKQNLDHFDGNSELGSGLLIYLVDEGFINNQPKYPLGNKLGTPFNVFVYRGSINGSTGTLSLKYAPLNSINQSVGEQKTYIINTLPYKSPNLFWHSYSTPAVQGNVSDLTYINSGIVIKFKEENFENESITFTVEWDMLPDPPKFVEREQLTDTNLYNTLLTLANKSFSEKLETNDFATFDTIDLSNKNIVSLNGFERFFFKSNALINLSNNNLSSLGSFETYYKTGSAIVRLNLAFNKFTSASKMQELNFYNRIVFAMQKPDFALMGYANQNLWDKQEADYLYYQNDYSLYYTLSTNYQEALISGANQLNSAGNFYFEFIAINSSFADYTIQIQVAGASLLQETCTVEVFDSTFLIENCIVLENISWQEISYQFLDENDNVANKNQITTSIGTKQLKFVSSTLKVELFFNLLVQDTEPPVISLESESTIFVLKGSEINPPSVTITDNYDDEQDLFWQTDSDLNNLSNGENQIEIYAVDSSGNMSEKILINIVILEITIKENLEIALNELFDYSLSYTFLPSEYQEQFEMRVEIEIDNTLRDTQTFKLIFENKQDAQESFEILGQVDVKDFTPPSLQLLSESEIFIFKGQTFEFPEVLIIDNYDMDLSAKSVQEISTYSVGVQNLDIYAEDNSGNRSNTIRVVVIVVDVVVQTGTVLNLNEEIDYESLITVLPAEYAARFDFEVLNEVNILQIGNQNFEIKVYLKQNLEVFKTVSGILQIRDIEPPTITFENGIKEVYLYIGESFSEPAYVVEDNYDNSSNIVITRSGEVRTYETGIYYVIYTARDTSGNTSTFDLKITVLPKPIENLEVVEVSNIKIITPNTTMAFKVNTNIPAIEARGGAVTFAWFVNGEKVKESKEEHFEFNFKTIGVYEIEVKAVNTDLDGNKVYSATAQTYILEVNEGGILDKYSLTIIAVIGSSIIGMFIVSAIVRKRRKMFY